MSAERDCWERLITLKVLTPDSFYSPDRAKQGWYSATLKTALKELDQAEPLTQPESRRRQSSTTQLGADRAAIRELQELAVQLLREKVGFVERTMLLRATAQERGLQMRDGEVMAMLAAARKALRGSCDGITPAMELEIPDALWAWEDVIRLGALNIVVALQKVGKTSLLLQMLRLWSAGAESFLGSALIGHCPPVVIVGTDMALSDWRPMLAAAGLMERTPSGRWRLLEPIVKLYSREDALHLDEQGLERLARDCEANPGALLLVDSFAAVSSSLGIDEFKPAAAEPIHGLCEVVERHAVTTVLIHHSSKSRAGERASNAARGSNAITAAASQLVSLRWHSDSEEDHRVNLSTEGRGGRPHQIVIEQVDRCSWVLHGSAADLRRKEGRQEAEDRLTDRQRVALEEARELWSSTRQEIDSGRLQQLLPSQYSQADGRRAAADTLEQLHRKGLLTKRATSTAERGKVSLFRPHGTDLSEVKPQPEGGSLHAAPLPPGPPGPSHDVSTMRTNPLPSGGRGKGGKGGPGREHLAKQQQRLPVGSGWDADGDSDPAWGP
jgi:hypothetical protein